MNVAKWVLDYRVLVCKQGCKLVVLADSFQPAVSQQHPLNTTRSCKMPGQHVHASRRPFRRTRSRGLRDDLELAVRLVHAARHERPPSWRRTSPALPLTAPSALSLSAKPRHKYVFTFTLELKLRHQPSTAPTLPASAEAHGPRGRTHDTRAHNRMADLLANEAMICDAHFQALHPPAHLGQFR
jgi:hypothetical protein